MKIRLLIAILLTVILAGCAPIEEKARDTAAALNGSITAAQAKYQTSCTANPTQQICKTINQGVAGQNALITSIQTYCGWSASVPPSDPTAKCVPVKSAEPALNAAIANAARLTTEIKGAL